MDKISIVVPCYNEEKVLNLFHTKLTETMEKMNVDYEVLFVNDGSKDHTEEILKLIAERDPHCYYFMFSRNFGKEAAMYAGLQHATGDYTVIMDADLQHPVSLLPEMYRAVRFEGYDCCGAKRIDRDGENRIRSFLSDAFYKVIGLFSSVAMNDGEGDFRMMNSTMRKAILSLHENDRYLKGIYSYVGFSTKWIPYHNVERAAGVSKWNFHSLFSYAVNGILSFSPSLIAMITWIGLFLLVAGIILFGKDAIFHTLVTTHVLLDVVLFVSGVQILCISLVGQYTSKDYIENKHRPIYILKETNQVKMN